MKAAFTSRRATVALGAILTMAVVVSPALGGPSLRSLVQDEVSKQLASSAKKKKAKAKRGPAGPSGPAGATGAAGAAGAAGAPGTALAYGQANNTTDNFLPVRTSGFTTLTNPAVGRWCAGVDASIASRVFDGDGDPIRPTVATVEFGNSTSPENDSVAVRGANAVCGPNLIEVYTYSAGALNDTVSFTIIIP